MPKMQNITLADGAATPVSHVFTPQRIDGNEVAQFKERVPTRLIGQPQLSVQLKEQSNGLNVVDVRLVNPTVVTVNDANGVPTSVVAYSESVFVSFKLPVQGGEQGRKNLRIMIANALLNADIAAVIDKGEALIGG